MKLRNSISRAVIAIAVFTILTTAYAAEVISPVNEAVGVMPGDKLTVSYSEAVNAGEKTVSVNDSEDGINTVTAEENILTIDFKNMDYGKRYKTVIKNALGETELVTFFNTGFKTFETLLRFGNGNMDRLWNGISTQGASVNADSEELKITSNTKGSVGGRINSSEFEITASEKAVLILKAASEQDVDFKIYFSKTGGNSGFAVCNTLSIEGGGTFKEYQIPLSDVPDWNGKIKQFMLEQTTKSENTVILSSFEIRSPSDQNTYIGDFDLYNAYGTEAEENITGKIAPAGTITASLAAVQSTEEKTVFLLIARYKDGMMTGVNCLVTDISDAVLHSPITVSTEAEAGETVKAFLRKGKEDARILKECISAEIE